MKFLATMAAGVYLGSCGTVLILEGHSIDIKKEAPITDVAMLFVTVAAASVIPWWLGKSAQRGKRLADWVCGCVEYVQVTVESIGEIWSASTDSPVGISDAHRIVRELRNCSIRLSKSKKIAAEHLRFGDRRYSALGELQDALRRFKKVATGGQLMTGDFRPTRQELTELETASAEVDSCASRCFLSWVT